MDNRYQSWFVVFLFWGMASPFSSVCGQNAAVIDSLHEQMLLADADTNKVLWLCKLGGTLAEIDSSKAFSYANEALDLSIKNDYTYGKAYALHIKGLIHDYNYNFGAGFDLYVQAVKIREKIGDHEGLAASYNNMAVLFYYQQKFDEALVYYQKAIEKERLTGDSLGVATVYHNMGALYRILKRYDDALAAYQQTLAIRFDKQDNKGIANTYRSMSILFARQQQYEKALDYGNKALELEKKLENLSGMAGDLMAIGQVYYTMGQLTKAKETLHQAIVYADSVDEIGVLKNCYVYLFGIDTLQGDYQASLNHHLKAVYYSEQFFKEKENSRIEVLKTIYETDKKDRAIEKSQQDNLILQQENDLQAQAIWFWILGLIAALLLASLLWYQNRLKRQNNRILQEKNEQVSAALAEKELLLKEIHHRVKNNLQIVSGLLHWQSQQSKDEHLKKTVKEGKNRLKSMAMIHQRLYEDDNLKAINIHDYIQELSKELLTSYGLKEGETAINLDIPPLQLDVDIMIPLGLIMTELISNALKHAFPEKDGSIEVSIHSKEEFLHVKIEDNGIGMPTETAANKKKSFGLRLVETLAQKLNAQMSLSSERGTCVQLRMQIKS